MTVAHKNYERLESIGLWQTNDSKQTTEVIVTFGNNTLVLRDIENRPLAHWSLSAIECIKKNQNSAIFSADPDCSETLEIVDHYMIEAIAEIRQTASSANSHKRRMRAIAILVILSVLIYGIVYVPKGITRYAASVMSHTTAKIIGERVQNIILNNTKAICNPPHVHQVLYALNIRLKGTTDNKIYIAPLGEQAAISLPGNIILLNSNLARASDDPALISGYILALRAKQKEKSDAQVLFETLGLKDSLWFILKGEIDDAALKNFTAIQLFNATPQAAIKDLQLFFNIAEVPIAPYIKHSELNLTQTYSDSASNIMPPILTDMQMKTLQNACTG